ncbi:MAG: cellulase family glycosylhydrolase [Oscillospiraceae bacterium]|nr:cellulase family glycosylhydrolase [Oscillospiraceae bacterium]
MRRAFSLVVAIVLLLSVVALPVPALAAEDTMTAWITDAEIANGQLGVSIFSREAIQRVNVIAATYLDDGQMADSVMRAVNLTEGGNHFVFLLPDGGESCRVFLLDRNFAPLCTSVETVDTPPEDYARAFAMGYVDEAYARRDENEQMMSTEFRDMLEELIGETAPEQLALFQSKVTEYKTPLTRNQAIIMIWYAAVCMGVDDAVTGGHPSLYNYEAFEDAFGRFGDDWEAATYLLPEVTQYDLGIETKFWGTQTDVLVVAGAWNLWHLSPTWGQPAIAPDMVAMSMHWTDAFTVEDAVCAISRLYDSYEDIQPAEWADIDSEGATVPFAEILTAEILAKAVEVPDPDVDQLNGLSLTNIVNGNALDTYFAPYDLSNIADWGFNQATVTLHYRQIFDEDITRVNLKTLKYLDEMIATALSRGIHILLDIPALPGNEAFVDIDNNFETVYDNDLSINQEKQAKAAKLWETLAERYDGIPGSALSFSVLPEPYDPVAWGDTTYSDAEKLQMYAQSSQIMINAIRDADPDRFILYTVPLPANVASLEHSDAELNDYQSIFQSFEALEDVRPIAGFCQEAYVYFNMNGVYGRNPDDQNNAMFVQDYPVYIYAAQKHITGSDYACRDGTEHAGHEGEYAGEHTLTIDGTLPAGTEVEVYIERWSGSGAFQIAVDDVQKISDSISDEETSFNAGEVLSRRVCFAESEKKFSLTLAEDAQSIVLSCTGAGEVWWSGIRLTLPQKYAVDRIYADTEYAANLEGREYEGVSIRSTSEILIGANTNATEWPVSASENPYRGSTVTIMAGNGELGYTSDAMFEQADVESIEEWGRMVKAFGEDLRFCTYWEAPGPTTTESLVAYYEDMLTMYDRYGFSWNGRYDYFSLTNGEVVGAETVKRGRYLKFYEELLQVMLRHRG